MHVIVTANASALTAHTSDDSLAFRTNGASLLLSPSTSSARTRAAQPVMLVYSSDPSIMAIMKLEKIYPRGRVDEAALSWSDGTQRNTKRYMDPSKHVWVKPSTRRFGSVNA